MLPKRDTFQIYRCTQTESEGMEEGFPYKCKQKESWVAVFISHKIDLKAVTRHNDKEINPTRI